MKFDFNFDFKFDKILAGTVFALIIFGLVMITSIGVPKSIVLSAPDILYPSCSDANVDCYLLFKNHLFRLFIGAIAFFISLKFPLKYLKKLSPIIFAIVILLLFFVLISGSSFGTIASSWLVIFNTSLQPSELAKIGLILYLAYYFSQRQKDVDTLENGFMPFVVLSGLVILPTLLQNDFGSTLVLSLIAVSVFFVAGASLKHLAIGSIIALTAAIVIISTVSHVNERFTSFLKTGDDCLMDECWQTRQANIAIGSGGFFGKGLTQGIQKSFWLPQASDDFIFAASAEELGFIRIVFIVIAFFIIAIRGFMIANKAPNTYLKLVAVGLTTWIVVQAYINISVNIGIAPVTGITLPFISYGGSSLLASMIAIGLLLNISKQTTNVSSIHRRGNWRSRRPQLSRYRRA